MEKKMDRDEYFLLMRRRLESTTPPNWQTGDWLMEIARAGEHVVKSRSIEVEPGIKQWIVWCETCGAESTKDCNAVAALDADDGEANGK